jgi:hypothetical protein
MSSAPSLNHSAADKKPEGNATHELRWMSYSFADETTFFCGDREQMRCHVAGQAVQILSPEIFTR